MRVSWSKKSRWERMFAPIVGELKGRQLTVNGRAITGRQIAKPAVRVVGGLAIATATSAIVSALRDQGGD
jgi:hypothetical protein